MKKLSKFVSIVTIFFSLILIGSCSKNDEPSGKLKAKIDSTEYRIHEAESIAIAYRDTLIGKFPIIDSLWTIMGISFNESSLPAIVDLNSAVSSKKDSITISALDENGNTYKIELLSSPYSGSLKSAMWRWPTGNEWCCLGISLAGAVISGGIGTYATIANAIAICAVEDKKKSALIDEDKSVIINGWYNGNLEFTLQEDVYNGLDNTHMNAYMYLYKIKETPIFVAEGLISSNNSVSINFPVPATNPAIVWYNVNDPALYTSVPAPINSLINYYKKNNMPYDSKCSRSALLGELIRLTVGQ